ncbi:MAG: hypothetical protein EXS37_21660 [Opitutus sp.]|nr:hypothetical protein [Opitutus sp.]
MVFTSRLIAVVVVALVFLSDGLAKNYRVNVAPADANRAAQVISFRLPADVPRSATLRGADGTTLPLQSGTDGEATFIVPFQQAREALTFSLVELAPTVAAGKGVEANADRQRVRVTVGGAPAFDYPIDREVLPRSDIKPEFKRAGYIHPVFSPSGRIVTDDYPSNHVHHHGIWSPWVKTKFQGRTPDFWNMGTKTGAEDFVALDRTWSGAVHGGFEARLNMVDLSAPTPTTVLNETWRVTAYAVPAAVGAAPVRVFDLMISQVCATKDALELPDYHYGGFGFRGADAWNGPGEAALFLTSDGLTDRIKGNNTRGRWCYLGGRIDGAIAGTAILGHPENFRAPQPMRLHPNMPYMSFVPQALGDFAIEPGRTYVARFRFVVADGAPDRAAIDAFWNGYAMPAIVKIVAEGPP